MNKYHDLEAGPSLKAHIAKLQFEADELAAMPAFKQAVAAPKILQNILFVLADMAVILEGE